jgi:hypothetical protein
LACEAVDFVLRDCVPFDCEPLVCVPEDVDLRAAVPPALDVLRRDVLFAPVEALFEPARLEVEPVAAVLDPVVLVREAEEDVFVEEAGLAVEDLARVEP